MAVEIEQEGVRDLEALGREWRDLETRLDHSFFQSWTWIGCLAAERYDDPVLLRAHRDGQLLGLALFNRRSGRLHLAESGDAERDRPFIEHNGPLASDPDVAAALLKAALRSVARLTLSGVTPALLDSTGGALLHLQRRRAPFVDLQAVRNGGGDYLATLSANTRQQIRRSNRFFSRNGPLLMTQPRDKSELAAWMEELALLHETSWQRRGQKGAFATPFLRRFHSELMARAFPRGELELLRISSGSETVGLLYNFRHCGRVYAYQSGLSDTAGEPHAKPGLTSHALAIGEALLRGDRVYDFLAGDQRYKDSLANCEAVLLWADLARTWSPTALILRLGRRLLGRAVGA